MLRILHRHNVHIAFVVDNCLEFEALECGLDHKVGCQSVQVIYYLLDLLHCGRCGLTYRANVDKLDDDVLRDADGDRCYNNDLVEYNWPLADVACLRCSYFRVPN